MLAVEYPSLGSIVSSHGGYFAGTISIKHENYALIAMHTNNGYIREKWNKNYNASKIITDRIDGKNNTQKLALNGNELARRISCLRVHGFADWYLPSACELRAMEPNLHKYLTTDQWYWTSTEFTIREAWAQDLEYGLSYASNMEDEFYVLPTRRIPFKEIFA